MRSRTLTLSAALVLGGFAAPESRPTAVSTEVTGTVQFDGGGSPEGVVAGDAVVYLIGSGLDAPPRGDRERPVLDQRDIAFVPHVLAIQAGEEVAIRNSDGITHNVKTRSRNNRPFNRAQLAGMEMVVEFVEPEVVTVVCNIHSQMSAYIVIAPNPYFARVRADGSFSISDVPPGTYQLVAWHERYGEVTSEVEVAGDGAVEATINFAN